MGNFKIFIFSGKGKMLCILLWFSHFLNVPILEKEIFPIDAMFKITWVIQTWLFKINGLFKPFWDVLIFEIFLIQSLYSKNIGIHVASGL